MKIGKKIINIEIGLTVGIETCPVEVEEITVGTIDQIIQVDHKTTIDMMIGETATDKMIDVTLIGKRRQL